MPLASVITTSINLEGSYILNTDTCDTIYVLLYVCACCKLGCFSWNVIDNSKAVKLTGPPGNLDTLRTSLYNIKHILNRT